MVQLLQFRIGVMHHLQIDRKLKPVGAVGDVLLEAATVGDGGIDPEHRLGSTELRKFLQDPRDRFVGYGNDGIGSGKTGQITYTAIHALKDDTVRKSSLHQDDGIECINMDGTAGIEMIHFPSLAHPETRWTYRYASHCNALALRKEAMVGRERYR